MCGHLFCLRFTRESLRNSFGIGEVDYKEMGTIIFTSRETSTCYIEKACFNKKKRSCALIFSKASKGSLEVLWFSTGILAFLLLCSPLLSAVISE